MAPWNKGIKLKRTLKCLNLTCNLISMVIYCNNGKPIGNLHRCPYCGELMVEEE